MPYQLSRDAVPWTLFTLATVALIVALAHKSPAPDSGDRWQELTSQNAAANKCFELVDRLESEIVAKDDRIEALARRVEKLEAELAAHGVTAPE